MNRDHGAPIPNLFIVGFPKSGTSVLQQFLERHPDVFVSRPREPLGFCKDFHAISNRFHGGRSTADNRATFRKVLEFLGVDTRFAADFRPVHDAKAPRFPLPNPLLRSPARRNIPKRLLSARSRLMKRERRQDLGRFADSGPAEA